MKPACVRNKASESIGGEAELDGIDLADVVRRRTARQTVYSQFGEKGTAIYMAVNRDWKYVHSAGDNTEFFFDRLADPDEAANLAQSTESGDKKEELRHDLLRCLESAGRSEAYTSQGGHLEWRQYAHVNEDYLENPDARLLFQDYPSYPMNLPGYA